MSWNQRLLKSLASLKLTMGLLLWLAFLCVSGTFIPQHAMPPMAAAPFMIKLAAALSIRDIFHSLWLLIPAVLLGLNAAACMYIRRNTFTGPKTMPEIGIHGVTVPAEAGLEAVSADVAGLMKRGYRVVRTRRQGREIIRCDKGRVRRAAPFLVHGSVILVVVGAALGFFGYRGSITVETGRETDEVTLDNGSAMRLPFSVRCNDFAVELYENGMPREYRSEIVFIRNGREVQRSSVLVNHPVKFSRTLFSQSGYERNAAADLEIVSPSGIRRITISEGSSFEMNSHRFTVVKVLGDIMGMGPGIHIIASGPEQEDLWIFQRFEHIKAMHPGMLEKIPSLDPSRFPPYTFRLTGMSGRYTTVLGVNYDPGIPLVGLGAGLFLAGICLASTVVHRRIWISLEQVQQGLCITMAQRNNGKPSKINPAFFERIDSLNGVKP